MCGISGFAHRDHTESTDKDLLKRMTDIMHHRGPDGEGFHVGTVAALGMRRLSIIDLKTGDQPIYNNQGRALMAVLSVQLWDGLFRNGCMTTKGI